jgi:hypothetical protein
VSESPPASVWIGLAEVTEQAAEDLLDGAPGAFVNVVTTASTDAEYREKVRAALDEAGFVLVELSDDPAPEPLSERQLRFTVSDDVLALADEVAESGEVAFDLFQAWDSDKDG